MFSLSSPAFENNGRIPRKFAAEGENRSPPRAWRDAPAETQSFVLVVEDPDALSGTFRHWALYHISAEEEGLPEGFGDAAPQGVNDFGHTHYDGPKPPPGHGIHHYHFRLAALDTDALDLGPRAKAAEIWKKAKPHIIAEADLVGVYETK
jgi:Raf kinase inhibitor-like YbhB/YbcL family protein